MSNGCINNMFIHIIGLCGNDTDTQAIFNVICVTGVAILLSQVVYLLRLAEVLPESSDAVPLLG